MLSSLSMLLDSSKVNICPYLIFFTSDLEDAIAFLGEAKTRLEGKQDAVFLCRIAQAEKKLNLG